jgi:hypothetical protein
MFVSLGCATFPPSGKFAGSLYLNEAAGYSFVVLDGWSPADPPSAPLARDSKMEVALRVDPPQPQPADSSQSSILVGVSLRRLVVAGGGPLLLGPVTETDEKTFLLRAWFPGLPASERERLTVEVVRFRANNVLTFSGPPGCRVDEQRKARATARAWNKVAVFNTRDRAFLFLGNLCDSAAQADFAELLRSVRLLR